MHRYRAAACCQVRIGLVSLALPARERLQFSVRYRSALRMRRNARGLEAPDHDPPSRRRERESAEGPDKTLPIGADTAIFNGKITP